MEIKYNFSEHAFSLLYSTILRCYLGDDQDSRDEVQSYSLGLVWTDRGRNVDLTLKYHMEVSAPL